MPKVKEYKSNSIVAYEKKSYSSSSIKFNYDNDKGTQPYLIKSESTATKSGGKKPAFVWGAADNHKLIEALKPYTVTPVDWNELSRTLDFGRSIDVISIKNHVLSLFDKKDSFGKGAHSEFLSNVKATYDSYTPANLRKRMKPQDQQECHLVEHFSYSGQNQSTPYTCMFAILLNFSC
jgi:hypothetical protein